MQYKGKIDGNFGYKQYEKPSLKLFDDKNDAIDSLL